MSVLKIENISFSYSKETSPVLRNISVSFPLGEQVAIIGCNGAGKTTLAKIILGMLRQQNGSIFIDGLDSKNLSIADIASKIGYTSFSLQKRRNRLPFK